MKNLPDIEAWKSLASSDIIQAASELGDQGPDEMLRITRELGIDYMVRMISGIGSDIGAAILQKLPPDFREMILSSLPFEKKMNLKEILSYPPGSAGALMSKEFFMVSSGSTIKEATEHLQSLPQQKKGAVTYIYVVDKERRIEGILQVRDLILCSPDSRIGEVARRPVVQAEVGMSQLAVANLVQKHHYLGIPVVDNDQRLIGVVRTDNVLKVLQEEANNDIAKIVGTSAEEIKTHSIRKIIGLRFPWLLVNIVSGLLCALISGVFRNAIQDIIALFLFVPVVLGLSESIGVQGATIVVRNIALGNISQDDFSRIFRREILVGMLVGLVCGMAVGAAAWFWNGSYSIGIAITSSMIFAMFISSLVGLLLPIVFKSMNIDPAMASGPITLAICDIQTLLVYFSVSNYILRI